MHRDLLIGKKKVQNNCVRLILTSSLAMHISLYINVYSHPFILKEEISMLVYFTLLQSFFQNRPIAKSKSGQFWNENGKFGNK